jgi:hypothetical protein
MNTDSYLLNEAYVQVGIQKLIDRELMNEGFWDSASALPDQVKHLQQWASLDLPSYIQNLGPFLTDLSLGVGGGAVATKVAGQGLMILAKKLNKEAEKNKETLVSMLPSEVQEQVKKIESLEQSDPQSFLKQKILINKNARLELEKAFREAGFKIDDPIIGKVFNWIGQLLNSTVGSIVGGIAIACLIQFLGFNPLPIFPKL